MNVRYCRCRKTVLSRICAPCIRFRDDRERESLATAKRSGDRRSRRASVDRCTCHDGSRRGRPSDRRPPSSASLQRFTHASIARSPASRETTAVPKGSLTGPKAGWDSSSRRWSCHLGNRPSNGSRGSAHPVRARLNRHRGCRGARTRAADCEARRTVPSSSHGRSERSLVRRTLSIPGQGCQLHAPCGAWR